MAQAVTLPFVVQLRSRRGLFFAGLLALVLIAASVALFGPRIEGRAVNQAQAKAFNQQAQAAVIALPSPDLLRPLTPEEAIAANKERAAAARPIEPATAFKPKFADVDNRGRALECMTQAIYYEAATEPMDGRRAVAQVVLNRVRHPAYPSSVCGVVYQGSERTTGCQFSFTCDGSLRRPPTAALWTQARKIATEALAGKVFAGVGYATHYHANYVLPYWADSLDKELQIGRHIFYRLKSTLGSSRAFNQKYRGREQIPLTSVEVNVAAQAVEAATGLVTEPITADVLGTALPAAPKQPPIAADLAHGQLLLDDAGALEPLLKGSQPVAIADSPACSKPVQARIKPLDNRSSSKNIVVPCH